MIEMLTGTGALKLNIRQKSTYALGCTLDCGQYQTCFKGLKLKVGTSFWALAMGRKTSLGEMNQHFYEYLFTLSK